MYRILGKFLIAGLVPLVALVAGCGGQSGGTSTSAANSRVLPSSPAGNPPGTVGHDHGEPGDGAAHGHRASANGWVTYHGDLARTGENRHFPFRSTDTWRKYAMLPLGPHGVVRGAPLLVPRWRFRSGPHAGHRHNLVLVTTTANLVQAYSEAQMLAAGSTPLWTRDLGTPNGRGGSNIPPPLGITSTPVVDVDGGRAFVMTMQDDGAGGGFFRIFSLDLDTGATLDSALLSDPGGAGRPTFDGNAQDQRGGLNLVGGRVYATFADFLAFDAGPFHGWVVACAADHLADQLFLSLTRTIHGGGAWGPGGAVAAPDGTLYISTGNGITGDDSPTSPYWVGLGAQHPADIGDYLEGVVRVGVTQAGGLPSLTVLDWYQPTWTRLLNRDDLDFGGSSPIVLPRIDGWELIVTTAKDGNVYLLDRHNLGHWGNELWASGAYGSTPSYFSNESKSAPAYHHDKATGQHFVYVTGSGTPGLAAFRVDTSGPRPRLVEAWNAGLTLSDAPSSPTVIASPSASGEGDEDEHGRHGAGHAKRQAALVWIADGIDGDPAVLRAFDAVTGAPVFSSDAVPANVVGASLPHFAPISAGGRSVFLGTANGLVAYTHDPSGNDDENDDGDD